VIKNKKKLENSLGIKITNRGREIFIESDDSLNEYIAEKVIEALDFGFSLSSALSIKDEDFVFEIINIKESSS